MNLFDTRTSGWWAAVLLASVLVFPGGSFAAIVEKIVVVVNGAPHTFSDFRKFTQTRLGRDIQLDELTSGRVSKKFLEEFITAALIRAEVKGTGIRVQDTHIDAAIQVVQKQNNFTLTQLADALKRDGKSMDQYRKQVRRELERGELINRNVRQKVHVTLRDAQRYYDANPDDYVPDLTVHLRHIMLRVEEGAPLEREQLVLARLNGLRQEVLDGADFATLARVNSEGAGAEKGGDIGWIEPNSLPDSLAEVATTTMKGGISTPVRTNLGYHLIRVEGRQGDQRLPFAEVSEQIREELYEKALDERFSKWLKTDLRKKYSVEVKLDGYEFAAEKAKRGTVSSLMASTTAGQEEKDFWDYLNPLTYILGEETVGGDQKIVKLFGVPLFTTDAGDDDDVPLGEPFERENPRPGKGSVHDAVQ